MSISSGFFNSLNGDRVYSADDLNYFFNGVMTDGIVKGYGSALEVTANGTLNLTVKDGKAFCLGRYVENVGSLAVEIEGGGTYPRIDAVVVGVNLTERTGSIYVKKGEGSSSPSYPVIENTETLKELCLAYVYVGAGATTITTVTDMRSDELVSGWSSITAAKGLKEYRATTTTTASQANYEISIAEFDSTTDVLNVFKNGLRLTENEYTVSGTGSTAYITLATTPTSNLNELEFVVIKTE